MNFGEALRHLETGGRARLPHWDKGAFIYLVPGSIFKVNREPLLSIHGEGAEIRYRAHIDICWRGPDGALNSGVHTATQCEMRSTKWEWVEARA